MGAVNALMARVVGAFVTPLAVDDYKEVTINSRGDLRVVQALPPLSELARLGNGYRAIGTTKAPVTALPTTAAHFSLFNGEADGGKSYLISVIGSNVQTSAGAAITLALAYLLNKGKQTDPAGAIAIKSLSGKLNYGGKGNCKASVTVTDDGWLPIGDSMYCAATSNDNSNIERVVNGKIVVPPGHLFSIATLCDSAGSAACFPYIEWFEGQIEVG